MISIEFYGTVKNWFGVGFDLFWPLLICDTHKKPREFRIYYSTQNKRIPKPFTLDYRCKVTDVGKKPLIYNFSSTYRNHSL